MVKVIKQNYYYSFFLISFNNVFNDEWFSLNQVSVIKLKKKMLLRILDERQNIL